jgi:prepilin-type N-terminal cleavage/methylation domain-containing protein
MQSNNKFLKKSVAGFSMIEMLVSISIIGLISALFLVNYQGNIRRSDLQMTTNILAADTRLAQSYSLGLIKYDNIFPDGGWGIDFDLSQNDRYYFFADGYDQQSDQQKQDNEILSEFGGRTILLPPTIKIKEIEMKKDGSTYKPNHLAVTFIPPNPQTAINDYLTPGRGDEVKIILENTRDNTTSTLLVNFVGLIDVLE